MALEALSSNDLLNFIIYETISATCHDNNPLEDSCFSLENTFKLQDPCGALQTPSTVLMEPICSNMGPETSSQKQNLVVQGRKKRRRRARVCKNKEEAETQRMTHIAVERNRRRQMNEHLAILRSLMPESYVQRGDQASIVGGAIEFVKELEHLLQTLETRKHKMLQGLRGTTTVDDNSSSSSSSSSSTGTGTGTGTTGTGTGTGTTGITTNKFMPPPFSQFFVYPQYTWSQMPNKYTSKSQAAVADIEVTLIETHANLRILSHKSPRLLSKMVAGFQALYLTVLHLNVTTMDPLVLYSISAKVEEGCQLTSVDDIAGAVHHMLRIIEEEAAVLC